MLLTMAGLWRVVGMNFICNHHKLVMQLLLFSLLVLNSSACSLVLPADTTCQTLALGLSTPFVTPVFVPHILCYLQTLCVLEFRVMW